MSLSWVGCFCCRRLVSTRSYTRYRTVPCRWHRKRPSSGTHGTSSSRRFCRLHTPTTPSTIGRRWRRLPSCSHSAANRTSPQLPVIVRTTTRFRVDWWLRIGGVQLAERRLRLKLLLFTRTVFHPPPACTRLLAGPIVRLVVLRRSYSALGSRQTMAVIYWTCTVTSSTEPLCRESVGVFAGLPCESPDELMLCDVVKLSEVDELRALCNVPFTMWSVVMRVIALFCAGFRKTSVFFKNPSQVFFGLLGFGFYWVFLDMQCQRLSNKHGKGKWLTEGLLLITVRHGSADTVVRAMNVFNGKRCFGGFL